MMNKKAKRIIGILIATNLISIFLLLNIQHNISKVKKQRELERLKEDTTQVPYFQNQIYIEQTRLHNLYETKQANIVMLGSSFTQRVNWSELLQRNDIVNRGIGSDVSEGYLHRLEFVMKLKPKVCFVEIGANDIVRQRNVNAIVDTCIEVLHQLRSAGIEVVLTKCFYVNEQFPNYELYNRKVDSLNALFDGFDKKEIIDINAQISEKGVRKKEFSLPDGIHLNANAYMIWKAAIEKKLADMNL